MRRILVIYFLILSVSSYANEEEHPLLPADTSSPRATYLSFMENCDIAYDILKVQGRSADSEEAVQRARDVVRRILRCLNTTEIAEFRRDNAGKEAAVALKEVLDRIEVPKIKDFPDLEAMTTNDGELIDKWTIPHTEITFKLVREGPLADTYQFSPSTVDRALEFLARVKHLPYKKGATDGFANTYLTSPGSKWLANRIANLPESMRARKNGQAMWQWAGLGIVLIVMVLVMILLYSIGRRMSRGGAAGGLIKYVFALAFPILAIPVPLQAQAIVTKELVLSGTLLYIINFNLSLISLFAGMVVILGIGRRVGEVIVSAPNINSHSIDAQLIRIMSRLIGFSSAMILLLQGGKHLGIPLSSLVAGAGVVGMALALSAQDLLKNIFGSIMLIMDKPFRVGERIKVKHYDGIVEEIGLRSTKVRLLNGHQAIIPNEDMAKTDIENIGRRPFIRRVSEIPLPMNIDAAKSKEAVEIVKGLLDNHEGFNPDFPPRVWLNDFERDHLQLKMIYWYHPPEYWEFTEHADQINRRLLEAFEKAGISIALPSFTTKLDDQSGSPVIPPED